MPVSGAGIASLRTRHTSDLAVIGFDDNRCGALTSPALTTVHIDGEAHGRQADRAVLGLSADGLSPTPGPGPVIVREPA